MKKLLQGFVFSLMTLSLADGLVAQGTKADYERMAKMSRLNESLLDGGKIGEVRWSDRDRYFCFWNETVCCLLYSVM